MFKFLYIGFALLAIINKAITAIKIHKINKIKGKIFYPQLTRLIYLFYYLPFFLPPLEFFLVKREINYFVSSAALILYSVGWLLSLWAVRTMDRYWTVEIEIRPRHPLIKKGPYRYLRHPHYLFTFIELACLPLIANAYFSLAVIALIFIPLYIARIRLEEKELIKKIGMRYIRYRKEVWGLFPFPIFKKGVKDDE